MRIILFIVTSFVSNVLHSQYYPDYNDGSTRVIFESGIGFATIGGIAFVNELGVNFNKNSIRAHLNLASELGSKTNGHTTNDFWIDVALTYGRMKTFSKSYLELNVGPSYYTYYDRYLTSTNWLGSSVHAVGIKEYQGIGGLVKIDYGRDVNHKIGIVYSLFFQINKDIPLVGFLVKFNLRSAPK